MNIRPEAGRAAGGVYQNAEIVSRSSRNASVIVRRIYPHPAAKSTAMLAPDPHPRTDWRPPLKSPYFQAIMLSEGRPVGKTFRNYQTYTGVRAADSLQVQQAALFSSTSGCLRRRGKVGPPHRRTAPFQPNRDIAGADRPLTGSSPERSYPARDPQRGRGEWKNAGSAEPVSMSRSSASAAARSAG